MVVMFEGDTKKLFQYFDTAISADLIKIYAYDITVYIKTAQVMVATLQKDMAIFYLSNGGKYVVYKSGLVEYKLPAPEEGQKK